MHTDAPRDPTRPHPIHRVHATDSGMQEHEPAAAVLALQWLGHSGRSCRNTATALVRTARLNATDTCAAWSIEKASCPARLNYLSLHDPRTPASVSSPSARWKSCATPPQSGAVSMDYARATRALIVNEGPESCALGSYVALTCGIVSRAAGSLSKS